MHKLSITALLFTSLALPGCIFAVGGTRHGWDGSRDDDACRMGCCDDCAQLEHVEHRLDLIEAHLQGQCKSGCPFCKPPAGTTPGSAPASGQAEAKPAGK